MQQGSPDADVAKATTASLLSLLTKREQEVLELMAFGLANKEIASRLSKRETVAVEGAAWSEDQAIEEALKV